MTSSAEGNELFTCTLRVAFRGGGVVAVPTLSFSKKEDAEAFNRERMGFLQAVGQGMVQLPNGQQAVQMPLPNLLGELGVAQLAVGIEVGELRNSSLVVAKPKILLAH